MKLLNNGVGVYSSQIRIFLIGFVISLPGFLYSLELHNLELVLEITEPDTSAELGGVLASGDVNGDGFSDIIVSAGKIGEKWCVRIYYGSETPDPITDLVLTEEPEDVGYLFGRKVGAGDVNGDEYADVIVIGGRETRVYFGGDPMDSLPDLRIKEYCEWMAPRCGDLNKDGFDDVIVSLSFDGWVKIYFGSFDMDTVPDIILHGNHLGDRLSSGFDVNNDGYDDLFVLAYPFAAPRKTLIYYGGDPMDTIPDVVMVYSGLEEAALVPDLTGDGFDDACVGKYPYVDTYWGGNPMDNAVDLIFSGDSGTRFGYAVGGAKVMSKDSLGDLVVGSCYYPDGWNSKGRVYVYLGDSLMDVEFDASVTGADSQQIGVVVASAGDINGDGIDEIMFSNCSATYKPHKVWVCKYTGPGVEETNSQLAINNYQLAISPNPVIRRAVINYQLPVAGKVSLKIYNVSGRLIKKLFGKTQKSGQYEVIWNGTDEKGKSVASGVYVFKLKVKNEKLEVERTKKMLFLKE